MAKIPGSLKWGPPGLFLLSVVLSQIHLAPTIVSALLAISLLLLGAQAIHWAYATLEARTGSRGIKVMILGLVGICVISGGLAAFLFLTHTQDASGNTQEANRNNSSDQTIQSTNQQGGFTGSQSGHINNYFGPLSPPPVKQPSFKSDAETPTYFFSIGCFNFRATSTLLSSIESGTPTPFISMPDVKRPHEWIPLISLYAINKELFADIRLFSPVTGEAFDLKKDTFKQLAPSWDVNFSDVALEVLNEDGVPIFQMIRKSPTNIQFFGLFRVPNYLLFLGFGDQAFGLKALKGEEANKYSPPPDFLPKIFRYPSWKFQGVYSDNPFPPPCPPGSLSRIFVMSDGLQAGPPNW